MPRKQSAAVIFTGLFLAGCHVLGHDPYHPGAGAAGYGPKIPPGHMPPPGLCRVWRPGVPPGQQSPPGSCGKLQYQVPPGAYLIQG